MGFFAHGTRGCIGVLIALAGLLMGCGNLGMRSPRPGRTDSPIERTAGHIEVSDNFDIPDLEDRFEDIARRVAPAVVAISATDAHVEADDALRSDRINPEKLAAMLDPVDRTVGTGFIIDSNGYIVTNDHVVSSNGNIWVTTDDHHVYPAIVVGTDPRADLAVLKIPATHLPTVHFSDAAPRRGQWSLALGNPYGLAGGGEMSVSIGIVSALNRSLPKLSTKEDRLYSDLIQTTAQINPGNSGGPLFDVHGSVIGINSAVILPQKATNGIGFAIPVTARVRHIITDLQQGREIAYGWLGVHVSAPTPLECKQAGLPADSGVKVDGFDPSSPAQRAKLQVGDVITRFNDLSIADSDQFTRLVGEAPIGKEVQATISRGGKRMTVAVLISRRPAPPAAVTRDTQRMRWRGMLLGKIPPHWDFGPLTRPADGLMVIAIDAQSPFIKFGVVQGSVINSVAGKPVCDIEGLQRILNETSPDACSIAMAKTARQVVAAGQ